MAQDQAERCLDAGIDTVIWNSETSESQRCSVESELRGGEPQVKLIYTTPESLRTPRLLAALKVIPGPLPCVMDTSGKDAVNLGATHLQRYFWSPKGVAAWIFTAIAAISP